MPFDASDSETVASSAELPQWLTPADVGRACDMSRRKAKNLLRAASILELHENGRWYVATARLQERLPDVFERVRSYVPTAAEDEAGEP